MNEGTTTKEATMKTVYEAFAGDGEEHRELYFATRNDAVDWAVNQVLSDHVEIVAFEIDTEDVVALLNGPMQHNRRMVYKGDADKARDVQVRHGYACPDCGGMVLATENEDCPMYDLVCDQCGVVWGVA